MKRLFRLSTALLCLLLVASAATAQDGIPAVDVKTLDGKRVNIQDYANNGKPTIISFWATWCKPCKKELDAITDVYEDWQADYDVELLAITIDTRRALAKVKPMVATKGWPFEVLSDADQKLQNALNIQSVPFTILLDADGNVVYKHTGYVPGDEDELEAQLQALSK